MTYEGIILTKLLSKVAVELEQQRQQLERGPVSTMPDESVMAYASCASAIRTLKNILEWVKEIEEDLSTNKRADDRAGRSVRNTSGG